MSKIKEIVKIQSSYSHQVNLKDEHKDRALNQERMTNYRPIKSHRKAFEIIAEVHIGRIQRGALFYQALTELVSLIFA